MVEDYNDQITIDEVECKVDNHTPKDFKPEYSYYSVGDVFYSDSRICYFPLSLAKKGHKGKRNIYGDNFDPRYFTSVYFPEAIKFRLKRSLLKYRDG